MGGSLLQQTRYKAQALNTDGRNTNRIIVSFFRHRPAGGGGTSLNYFCGRPEEIIPTILRIMGIMGTMFGAPPRNYNLNHSPAGLCSGKRGPAE